MFNWSLDWSVLCSTLSDVAVNPHLTSFIVFYFSVDDFKSDVTGFIFVYLFLSFGEFILLKQ